MTLYRKIISNVFWRHTQSAADAMSQIRRSSPKNADFASEGFENGESSLGKDLWRGLHQLGRCILDVADSLRISLGYLNRCSENSINLMLGVSEALDDVDESIVSDEVRAKAQRAQAYLEANKKSKNVCDSITK